MTRYRSLRRLVCAALVATAAASAHAASFIDPWPDEAATRGIVERQVSFPSHSPFSLADVGRTDDDPATEAVGTLFLPPTERSRARVPAVVMLHGSAGVQAARELTYGRQLAAMGITALAIDSFAARRDRATAFIDRLIEITEAMFIADAYAALDFLAAMPEVDGRRVALIGFSYGAMAATYAAFAQVAARYAPDGARFAGHVAFYGPCIARFDDVRTTGAPVAMLYGTADEIIDPIRCVALARDLEAGGSRVEIHAFAGAHHQWDGGRDGPFRIGRTLNGCRLGVSEDGNVRDRNTWLPMSGPFLRKVILGLCAGSSGYLIGRDDAVRARSNRVLASFLARAFGLDQK